jgi:acyl-coenzyme A thioesterase PaaI-like protein
VTVQVQIDPYAERAGARVTEASPERAVVEQPGLRELDNHLGIRHASALYTTMYAAAQALVRAAAGDTARARLTDSVTTYPYIPVGLVTSVAEPAGGDWVALAGEIEAGRGADLKIRVESSNEDGRTVSTLDSSWRVEPLADG